MDQGTPVTTVVAHDPQLDDRPASVGANASGLSQITLRIAPTEFGDATICIGYWMCCGASAAVKPSSVQVVASLGLGVGETASPEPGVPPGAVRVFAPTHSPSR